jgi:hypothetical protein
MIEEVLLTFYVAGYILCYRWIYQVLCVSVSKSEQVQNAFIFYPVGLRRLVTFGIVYIIIQAAIIPALFWPLYPLVKYKVKDLKPEVIGNWLVRG